MNNRFHGNQFVSKYWIKTKRIIRNAFILAFFIDLVGWSVYVGMWYAKYTIKPEMASAQETDLSTEMYKIKVEQLKDQVVNDIMNCESAGHKESDAVIIMDTNNKLSYGRAMFQISTIKYFYTKLYGKEINNKDAVTLALDDNKASELAKKIMFETPNMAGKDWTNCAKKTNADARIKLIKEFESQYK